MLKKGKKASDKFHKLLLDQLKKHQLSDDLKHQLTPFLNDINSQYKALDTSISTLKEEFKSNLKNQEEYNQKISQENSELLDQLESLAQISDDIVFQTDPQGYLTYLNQAFEKQTGLKIKDSLGKSYKSFLEGFSSEVHYQLTNIEYDKNDAYHSILLVEEEGISKRWYDISIRLIRDENKKPKGTIGRLVNLTNIKRQEAEIQLTQQRYERIYNSSAIGLFRIVNGKVTDANRYLCELLEIKKEEIIDKNPFKFIHEDDIPFLLDEISKIDPESYNLLDAQNHITARFITKTGKLKIGRGYFTLEKSSLKNQFAYIFTVADVTENTKNLNILKEREATLNAVLESTPDNILVFDNEHRLIHFDKTSEEAFKRNFNFKLSLNKPVFEKLKFDQADQYVDFLKRTLKGEHISFEFVTPKHSKTKNIRHSIIRFNPVLNAEGIIIGAVVVAHEVTEMVNYQKQLQESQATLESIINATPNGIYAVDTNYKILAINEPTEKDFQNIYNIDLKVGDDVSQKVEKKVFKKWDKEFFQRIFRGESFVTTPTYNIGDAQTYYRNQYVPVRNNKGEIIAALEVSKNITEEELTRRLIIEREKQYRYIFENSNDSIMYVDLDEGKIIDFNAQCLKLYACQTREELQGMNEDVRAPEFQLNGEKSSTFFKKYNDIAIKNGKSSYTFEGRDLNGNSFIAEGIAVHDNISGSNRMLYFAKDITQSYLAQKRSDERKKIYEALIENSFVGIDIVEFVIKDGKAVGELIVRNSVMQNFTNFSNDSLLELSHLTNISAPIQDDNISYEVKYKQIVDELVEKNNSEFNWIYQNDKKIYYVEARDQIIQINDKNILIRVHKDYTQQRNQQDIISQQIEDLNLTNNELKKYIDSNLQLENFAYIASHDLKAPIRTVSSFAELLHSSANGKLEEKEKEFLRIIRNSSKNMQDLIEDLLIFSRVNTSKTKISDSNVESIVENILAEIQSQTKSVNAIIILKALSKKIRIDQTKIRQVFQNLITNALKYRADDKSPKIEISCIENKTHWQFQVKDNGIGIDNNFMDKIFLLFQKLHSTDKYEGSGIGLAICKKIVEQHDGRIWVESKLGKGSKFFFTISKAL